MNKQIEEVREEIGRDIQTNITLLFGGENPFDEAVDEKLIKIPLGMFSRKLTDKILSHPRIAVLDKDQDFPRPLRSEEVEGLGYINGWCHLKNQLEVNFRRIIKDKDA